MQSSLSTCMVFSIEAMIVNFTISLVEGKFHHRWTQPGRHSFKVLSLSASSERKSIVDLNARQFSMQVSNHMLEA